VIGRSYFSIFINVSTDWTLNVITQPLQRGENKGFEIMSNKFKARLVCEPY